VIATSEEKQNCNGTTILPVGRQFPELMTEDELIEFLRIRQISKATDHHNVISHLKRCYNLPCIHICGQPLYPIEAIRTWIRTKTEKESQ
jgi:hypothetical protein